MKDTTKWALALCVAAGVGVFMPWHSMPPGTPFHLHAGVLKWHGGAIGSLFFLLACYLVSTSPLTPKPAWRPVVTAAAGAIALVVFNLYGYGPGRTWTSHLGPWVTFIAILGTIALAGLELREILAERQRSGE